LARIGYHVKPTSVSGYELDRLLQSFGLSLDKVKLVSMPNSATTLQGLQSGSVDVPALTEPWISRVRSSSAGDVWASRNSMDPNAQLAVVA
jgi:ABC-type nitrate/sulfonate/bicarbonate transport system substrate-binding protein